MFTCYSISNDPTELLSEELYCYRYGYIHKYNKEAIVRLVRRIKVCQATATTKLNE